MISIEYFCDSPQAADKQLQKGKLAWNMLQIHQLFLHEDPVQLKNDAHIGFTFVGVTTPSWQACSPFCSVIYWVNTVEN
jgi:hypothetical protein